MLHGDRGSLRAGDRSCLVFNEECDGEQIRYPASAMSVFALEIAAFVDYVLSAGVEGPTSGVGERRSLAVVQAGYESVASGRAVDLEQRFGGL